MITSYDQLGRVIHLRAYPQRIISVVPSQTELLFELGLEEKVIGITKFCIHPDRWFRNKTRVGGTKTLKIEKIHSLQPDLIIANKEENTKEQVEELASQYPVWISDVNDLKAALQMIQSVGQLTNTSGKANHISNKIEVAFKSFSLQQQTRNRRLKTAYLIWKNPYMAIGGNTFINAMLKLCGLTNIFEQFTRYPKLQLEDLKKSDNSRNVHCELLLLSSEPYPFSEKHIEELQFHLPETKIILVDGEMFSWYGSRLLHAPAYFEGFLEKVHS